MRFAQSAPRFEPADPRRLPWVLSVGVVSAAAGDNIGYWIGRRYGAGMLERFRRLVRVAPQRFEAMRGFLIRHGPFGVFVARFIAGLRFLAGPLVGAVGLRFIPFTTANVLGARCSSRWRSG